MISFTPHTATIPGLLGGSVTQIRAPLDPQPGYGVDVTMIEGNVSPRGVVYGNHAMTISQAEDTQFYSSPFGVEGGTLVCRRESELHGERVLAEITPPLRLSVKRVWVDEVDGVWSFVAEIERVQA